MAAAIQHQVSVCYADLRRSQFPAKLSSSRTNRSPWSTAFWHWSFRS